MLKNLQRVGIIFNILKNMKFKKILSLALILILSLNFLFAQNQVIPPTDNAENYIYKTVTKTISKPKAPLASLIFCPNDYVTETYTGTCEAEVDYWEPLAFGDDVFETVMPPHSIALEGDVRGYWFQAPCTFVMTTLYIPDDETSGLQNIQVMKFAAEPTLFPEFSEYTEMWYFPDQPESEYIVANILALEGEYIGILAQRGTYNSYASTPATINIDTYTIAISRFGSQNPIFNGEPAPQGSFWAESFGFISRVNFQYILPNGDPVTQIEGLSSGSTFPGGITTNTFELTSSGETCSFNVIVEDNEAPIPDVEPLPDVTVECVTPLTPPTSTDNCGYTITATTEDPTTYTETGTYTVTWTYTDQYSNTISQNQTIFRILDTTTLFQMLSHCRI